MSREIDFQVAERVMGWTKGMLYWRDRDGNDTERYEEYSGYPEDGEGVTPNSAWSPSTDIADAWQVVETLVKRFYWLVQVAHCIDMNSPIMVGWMCRVNTYGLNIVERADTAPMAICLAALKVAEADPIVPGPAADPITASPADASAP